MEHILDVVFTFIQTNPWAALILFIAGILGIMGFIFAIVTWYRGKPKSEISVYKTSQCLYSNERIGLEECELRKGNDIIDELYEAAFVIINTGNKRIDRSELAKSAPLKIECGAKASDDTANYGIVDFEFSFPELVKKNSIKGNLEPDGKALIIDFDFLEKGETIRVKIRYKGKGSFVYCAGNIKAGF